MRGRLSLSVWLAVLAACGSVSNNPLPDAPPGDGAAAKPGDVIWVRSMSAAFALGLADGPGGLTFTGSITAPTDFGGGLMTPLGATDLAIGNFKADDGSYVYQVRHNDASAGSVFGFLQQADSIGNPLIGGVSYGGVDLGKGHVDGGGGLGSDGFIGRYGPGAPAWVDRIVGPGEDKILGTAPAPGGEVYIGGWFEQTATWNGGTLVSKGNRDFFIARLNTFTGAISLTTPFASTSREELSSIAGDGTNLIIGGFFEGTLAMGGTAQSITAARDMAGAATLDVLVAKLDASATPVWAVRFGGPGEDRGPVVALDATGDIYVAGAFQSQVAFGAVNLISNGMHDSFLAKLRGDTGAVLWAVQLGGAGDDSPGRVVVDRAGHPVMIGATNGDIAITSFEPNNGAIRWQVKVASPGIDRGQALTVGTTGDLYAGVSIEGAFDFGKPLIGPPSPTSVVLRIAP